jgi:hypothetical protein
LVAGVGTPKQKACKERHKTWAASKSFQATKL